MLRLASILYSLIGTSVAGALTVAVLTAGYVTWTAILAAAVIGFIVALPISYFVAKTIVNN